MSPDQHRDSALDPQALEQAADWLMQLADHPASAEDLRACEQWRALNPENERAWARALRLKDVLASIPASLAQPVLDRRVRSDRRAAIKSLLGLGALVPAGWLAWQSMERAKWQQTIATRTGQRHQLRLPDQGIVELDTDTALDLAYTPELRLLQLRHGQILVETAPDLLTPVRPFRVDTTHGQMQALGTRFDVRVGTDHTRLSVFEGAVLAVPSRQPSAAVRVEAGQSIRLDAQAGSAPAPVSAAADAWVRGMLPADGQSLSGFVDEVGRYRRGILRCDPSVADLKVSGAFPLDDTDRVLAMLTATYPLAVERRMQGWWTTIVPRSA